MSETVNDKKESRLNVLSMATISFETKILKESVNYTNWEYIDSKNQTESFIQYSKLISQVKDDTILL